MAKLLKNDTAARLAVLLSRGVDSRPQNFRPPAYSTVVDDFPGDVRIYGVWQTEVVDGVKQMKSFNTDGSKPYVVIDELTKSASESADDMPLDGEPNRVWYRKSDYGGRAIDHR